MYVHGNPHTVFRTELKSAVVLHFTSVGRWFRLGGGGGGGGGGGDNNDPHKYK